MGYSYYNESLMRKMTEVAPLGKLMHLTTIEKFGNVLGQSLNLISALSGEPLAIMS
jgi:hypothetical protein